MSIQFIIAVSQHHNSVKLYVDMQCAIYGFYTNTVTPIDITIHTYVHILMTIYIVRHMHIHI